MDERVRSRSSDAWIIATAGALVALALIAAWLLAPAGSGEVQAAEVDVYFPVDAASEGSRYAGGQRWLGLSGRLIEFAILGLAATVGMALLGRARGWLPRGEVLAAIVIGVGLALAVFVATLLPSLIAHERAVDFGISTQGIGSWFADRGRGLAFTLLFAGLGAGLLVWVQRKLPRLWWLLGAGLVVGFAIIQTWLAPVVIAPAFNDFEPLDDGEVREEVLDLAARAGVDVGEVYEIDASRRSNSFNAYVGGIGETRRVVIYDNLLEGAGRPALRSVVAHELGHVAGRDIWRGLGFVAIVAPLGMLLARLIGDRLALRVGSAPGRAVAVAPYGFAITIVAFGLGVIGNQLSRDIERAADRFALELTDDPQGLVCLQQRIAAANVSDLDPPAGWQILLGTHPSKLERIGAATDYAAERGLAPPDPATCRGDGASAAGSGR